MIKVGEQARIKTHVPQGTVLERRFDADDNIEYRLEYTDANGEVQQRWCKEAELEPVT